MRFSPPRTLLTLALTSIGLVMAAGPALGHPSGDGNGHRGKVGRHAFIDSEDRPGTGCRYHPVETSTDVLLTDVVAELSGVGVRPPKVAAINRTDHVDYQRVGWMFILQENLGAGWINVKRSRLQVRRTSDHKAAEFSRMAVRYDGNPEADYRVKTKAYWFRHRHRIGVAVHVVDYYRVRGEVTKGSCPGGIPGPDAP